VTSMNVLNKYINGNYTVTIFDDGTKEREYEGIPVPKWPESCDVKVTDYCDANCPFCFHPDSEVMTLLGNKKISELVVGQLIYSFDETKKQIELSTIEQVITKNVDEKLIVIELENGKVIKCTYNHEIFTNNRGWVEASKLSIEDDINHIL